METLTCILVLVGVWIWLLIGTLVVLDNSSREHDVMLRGCRVSIGLDVGHNNRVFQQLIIFFLKGQTVK